LSELPVALALALAGGAPADEAAPPPVAFVYVEANVGSASGGHSALRIGDRAYHYHHSSDDRLELERDEWPTFCRVYAGLENRTLHVATLDVAAAAAARIAVGFDRAFVTQERDVDRLRRLAADVAWWAALRDGGARPRLPPLRGAGLLAAMGNGDPDALALRESVAAALGDSFLAESIAALDRELRAPLPGGDATDLEPLRERLLLREALCSLEEGRPVASEVLVDDVDPTALSAGERAAIAAFRARLAASIVALLRSNRPDRGFPLEIEMARHLAAARSLRCGRLITLDATPDDAQRVERGDAAEAAAAARVAARGLAWCRELRGSLLTEAGFDEPLFALLEESLSRCREAQRAADGEPLRLFDGRVVPSAGRTVEFELPPVALGTADAAARCLLASRRRDEFERTLHQRQAYDLFERNCATELVRTLDGCFEDDAAAAAALGARLEPGARLSFVPFLLDREVTARLRLTGTGTIPSRRHAECEELARREPGLATALRESTTFTSTIYTPRQEDGAFLFFTDDALLLRPLAGAANLGYGVVRGLGGLLCMPFDQGRELRAGWSGVLFSLPELAFCNVRKGTFRDVEPVDAGPPTTAPDMEKPR
jgi:hypothetical protein